MRRIGSRKLWALIVAAIAALAAVSCGGDDDPTPAPAPTALPAATAPPTPPGGPTVEPQAARPTEAAVPSPAPAPFRLTSTAFEEREAIAERYTCDGEDVSPPLRWTGVPEGAVSVALIVDDPDAPRGTWVHWVLYSLPADVTELPEGVSTTAVTAESAINGENDFGDLGYGGPCPPRGDPHRYFFKLYALDSALDLESGDEKEELLKAMEGHVVTETSLMGTYKRKAR